MLLLFGKSFYFFLKLKSHFLVNDFLSFFDEEPYRFRGLLGIDEQADVAAHAQNAELRNAAQQIRSINAVAGHIPAP